MHPLHEVAPAFVVMAHSIVWCAAATVDEKHRPWSRILHPFWEWNGQSLVGWVGVTPTAIMRTHLHENPYVSCSYWNDAHDTCSAEANATLSFDDETRERVWHLFKNTPPPLGYDPAMTPVWNKPTDDDYAVLRLDPWRLRVFPGAKMLWEATADLDILTWRAEDA
jgi:hypothetical protein